MSVAALLVVLSLASCHRAAADAGNSPEHRELLSSDYVIVGGGTAGCALAARLCEALPHASVTLLERGHPRSPAAASLVQQVRQAGEVWMDPDLTENFRSAPNDGLGGRSLDILTGATLGGSSAINAGQWSIPGLEEVAGWGFTGLTESAAARHYETAAATVGVAVPAQDLQQQYVPLWLRGAAATGIPTDVDPLSLSSTKPPFAAYNPVSADAVGRRRDSCTAYVEPVRHGVCRNNLEVVQAAVVTRIVVESGRAIGVDYLKKDEPADRQERFVLARREVISAAGPYGSPKLLQLSGIGPAALLASVGVPLVQDLPVGQSVQGRVVGQLIDIYTDVPLAPEANTSVIFSNAAREQFRRGGGGVLGITISALVGHLPAERCLIGGTVAIGSTNLDTPAFAVIGIPAAISRGTLSITPATVRDPTTPPDVRLNLLSDPQEAWDLARCLTRLNDATAVIRPELGMFNVLPGTPEVNETHVRTTSDNSYHFAAGCGVGEVVDGAFRVLGIDGLRVVDASVIPQLPFGSGLMGTVYALAEHAAELIVKDESSCRGFQSRKSLWPCHEVQRGHTVGRRTRDASQSESAGNGTASAQAHGTVTFTIASADSVA